MTRERQSITLVDIEEAQAKTLSDLLESGGFEVRAVSGLEPAWRAEAVDGGEIVLVPAQVLRNALRHAAGVRGRTPPATAEEKLSAIAAIVNGTPAAGASPEIAAALTSREREIVDLLANGARVVTIARHLGLSPHTVRNHLKSALRKLDLKGQHELFEYWRRGA